MPGNDGTGRLGRGKNCDETAKSDRAGGRGQRPMDGRGRPMGRGRGGGRGRGRW